MVSKDMLLSSQSCYSKSAVNFEIDVLTVSRAPYFVPLFYAVTTYGSKPTERGEEARDSNEGAPLLSE